MTDILFAVIRKCCIIQLSVSFQEVQNDEGLSDPRGIRSLIEANPEKHKRQNKYPWRRKMVPNRYNPKL